MEDNKTTMEEIKKFTYEQLEQIASNLSTQVQQLSGKLQEANMFNAFKRLDYCLKVVELNSPLFSAEFIDKCAKEVEDIMTVPTEETVEE